MALCELALLEVNPGPFFIKVLELMRNKRFLPSRVDDVVKFINQNYNIGFRGYREQNHRPVQQQRASPVLLRW